MQTGSIRRFIINVDKEFDERYAYLNFWDLDEEERVYNGYGIHREGIAKALKAYTVEENYITHVPL